MAAHSVPAVAAQMNGMAACSVLAAAAVPDAANAAAKDAAAAAQGMNGVRRKPPSVAEILTQRRDSVHLPILHCIARGVIRQLRR